MFEEEFAQKTKRSLQAAAEQGYTDAPFILGQALWQRHAGGEGSPEDTAEAQRCLQYAAERGHTDAQFAHTSKTSLVRRGLVFGSTSLVRRGFELLASGERSRR